MNMVGKATTIFLLVLAILSLCLTAGTLVLFKQEKDKRISLEQQLEQISNVKLQLERQLSESKKQALLLEERLKESDTKYTNLSNEIEVEKSFREQLTLDNNELKDNLSKESKEKESIKSKLSHSMGELKALREKLKSLQVERLSLENKIKNLATSQEVSLEKIVVSPEDVKDGSIAVINKEFDFAVINLGEQNGITPNQTLSVYRANKYLGDLKVERVQENLSVANFIAPLNKDKVKEGDKVSFKK
ncbi:MAG: hypothetical protein Q8O13_08950 [Candidatus Omnitrophota bacterium]|nr:hypothetical protein [Candidatus Omnitrophota bacterium]